ncbi:dihydrofolate reductase family protein [Streptomyces sp. NPDC054864]
MGLGTYRPALDNGITSPYAHLRQYVASSTLEPDTDPAVTVVPSDPLALVCELKGEVGAVLDVWLCGGGRLAGTLMPEIDELSVQRADQRRMPATSAVRACPGWVAPT